MTAHAQDGATSSSSPSAQTPHLENDKIGLLPDSPSDSESIDLDLELQSPLNRPPPLDSHLHSFLSSSACSSLVERLRPCLSLLSRLPSIVNDVMITPILSTQWRSLLTQLLLFLVPSFLQGAKSREMIRPSDPSKLSPTAYLDGVRGLAALFVFFCHYSYQCFHIAFSWGCEDDNWSWLKLPIIRLWYQGPMAVGIFYVISGYALSYRAIRLVRQRAWLDFSNNLSSLVFRRGIRLYLPTATSTLIVVLLLRVGAYEWNRDFANDPTYMKNIIEPHPVRLPTASEQLVDWLKHLFDFIHVFGWERYPTTASYDVHLWTIPTEFRCSLYLFLVLMATARLKTWARFLTAISVLLFSYGNSRWDMMLFICGMLLAEHDHIRGAHLPASPAPPLLPVSATAAGDEDDEDEDEDDDYSSSSDEKADEKPLFLSSPTSPISPASSTSSSSSSSFPSSSPGRRRRARTHSLTLSGTRTRTRTRALLSRANIPPVLWALLSILALYLLSFPDDKGAITPGWQLLTSAIPTWWDEHNKYRYWQSIGAVLFLLAIAHSHPWQRLFSTAPIQYLGKISYALYIVHGPVMHTLGYAYERTAYALTGTDGYWFNAGFALSACLAVPTVVWCADVFWRAVDIPSVKFAKWLENKWLARE